MTSSLGVGKRGRARRLTLVLALLCAPKVADAQSVEIEYVAHAAVIIQAGSTRVLIDPYDGSRWMGYGFPSDLEVDAVLITHPHYDHNASYYAGVGVPVLTEPGSYRVGDVELRGLDSEHVGGARFRSNGMAAFNVIWTVVVGDLRLTHVGDNRPLTHEDLEALGGADVLFIPPFHQLPQSLAEAEALGARVVIPIHNALPGLRAEGFTVPDVEDWLAGADAQRHDNNRLSLTRAGLPDSVEIHVLQPHPGVRGWTEELQRAWTLFSEARALRASGDAPGAIPLLTAAVELGPEVMSIALALGEVLVESGRSEDAVRVWELALARSVEGDVEPTLRIRGGLAGLYVEAGRLNEAELLYRAIARAGRTWAEDVVEEADAFLRERSRGR
jgi:L-ascorbate metabolism protein UlaG (beta-lactamase superfamily)